MILFFICLSYANYHAFWTNLVAAFNTLLRPKSNYSCNFLLLFLAPWKNKSLFHFADHPTIPLYKMCHHSRTFIHIHFAYFKHSYHDKNLHFTMYTCQSHSSFLLNIHLQIFSSTQVTSSRFHDHSLNHL